LLITPGYIRVISASFLNVILISIILGSNFQDLAGAFGGGQSG
jgi:hypothetical protein